MNIRHDTCHRAGRQMTGDRSSSILDFTLNYLAFESLLAEKRIFKK